MHRQAQRCSLYSRSVSTINRKHENDDKLFYLCSLISLSSLVQGSEYHSGDIVIRITDDMNIFNGDLEHLLYL